MGLRGFRDLSEALGNGARFGFGCGLGFWVGFEHEKEAPRAAAQTQLFQSTGTNPAAGRLCRMCLSPLAVIYANPYPAYA